MSAPEVERRRIRTVRVEMDGGRVLKAGVWPGEPGEVFLRVSSPEAPPGGRATDSFTLSAGCLPALREALAALDREEP